MACPRVVLICFSHQIAYVGNCTDHARFAPSRPFTNALLHNNEITALIRDPELHERGLFSVHNFAQDGESQSKNKSYTSNYGSSRLLAQQGTQHQESAVARVLGNEMLNRIQQSNHHSQRGKGVDIEVLLQGAEKLCMTFNVPGTLERIQALRSKHKQVSASVARFEVKVAEQQTVLSSYNAGTRNDEEEWGVGRGHNASNYPTLDSQKGSVGFDLEAEEQAILELEMRKTALEARVSAIEKDLGELLR